MAWENDLIRTTNEIARLNRKGGHKALALGARELCTAYSNLLADSGFAESVRKTLPTASSPGVQVSELRSHVNTAIALLVEAGVDGEQAVDALRSIQGLLNPPTPPVAGQVVTLPAPQEFFELLRDAKDTACELSRLHGERTSRRRRWLVIALVGGVLLGLPAAPVAASVLAAVGGAAVGTIVQALGAAIVVEGVKKAITEP
jgi:hypothetical protein